MTVERIGQLWCVLDVLALVPDDHQRHIPGLDHSADILVAGSLHVWRAAADVTRDADLQIFK